MKPRQDGIHSNRTRVLTTVQRVRDNARVNSILPAMSQSAAFSLRKEGSMAKTAQPRRRNGSTRKAQRGPLGEMSKKVQEG